MVLYSNGKIPAGVLKTYASGTDSNGYWEFQSTPATWARYQAAKRYAEAHFGRTLYIRSGWNIYRPYAVQQAARIRECAKGNCNGAAVAGYSSHGGNWNGRDCLAIDIDPNGLSWGQVWEACRAAGFSCGLITQAISGIVGGEPWHIIDFNAFVAFSGDGSSPFPIPNPIPIIPKEEDMSYPLFIDGKHKFLVAPGFIKHFTDATAADLTRNIVTTTDAWIQLTSAQFASQLDSFGIPRDVVDFTTGAVYDVDKRAKVAGGMWSWARNAAYASALPTPPATVSITPEQALTLAELIASKVKAGATPDEIAVAVRAKFNTDPLK